jgi:hypothetical protein
MFDQKQPDKDFSRLFEKDVAKTKEIAPVYSKFELHSLYLQLKRINDWINFDILVVEGIIFA